MEQVNEMELKDELAVFPNPASDQLHIHFGNIIGGDQIKMSIMNVMWQTIKSQDINPDEADGILSISVKDLAPGNH